MNYSLFVVVVVFLEKMVENLLPLFLVRGVSSIGFVFIMGIFGQNIFGTGECIRLANATFIGAVIVTVLAVPILNVEERENNEEKRIEEMFCFMDNTFFLFVCLFFFLRGVCIILYSKVAFLERCLRSDLKATVWTMWQPGNTGNIALPKHLGSEMHTGAGSVVDLFESMEKGPETRKFISFDV